MMRLKEDWNHGICSEDYHKVPSQACALFVVIGAAVRTTCLTVQSQTVRSSVTSQSCYRRRDLNRYMLRRMMKYVVQKENVDVLKPQCSNKIIRNVLCSVYFPAAIFFVLLYLVLYST